MNLVVARNVGPSALLTAVDLNNRECITGKQWIQAGDGFEGRPYLYDPELGVLDMGTLGGPTSEPYALNNLGQVVGEADTDVQVGPPSWNMYLRSRPTTSCEDLLQIDNWLVMFTGGHHEQPQESQGHGSPPVLSPERETLEVE